MDGFGLQLPTIQNWSCHSCSECCTRHVVEITEEERQRLLDQGWSDEDEFTEGTPVMVRDLGPFWNRRWRLGQKPVVTERGRSNLAPRPWPNRLRKRPG